MSDQASDVKWCRCCDRHLPLSSFSFRRASPDGLSYKCKECVMAYSKATYANLAKRAEIKRRAKLWSAMNPSKRTAIRHKWSKNNKNKKAAYAKKRMQILMQQEPERVRLIGRMAAHTRRARKSAGGEMPTVAVVSMIIATGRGRCVYCANKCTSLTIDHFNALSKGGNNNWSNLIPCCLSCNTSKNNKDGADWLFEKHGDRGLVDSLIFMKAVRKAMRRLFVAEYGTQFEHRES